MSLERRLRIEKEEEQSLGTIVQSQCPEQSSSGDYHETLTLDLHLILLF